jgi:hypothetical protein
MPTHYDWKVQLDNTEYRVVFEHGANLLKSASVQVNGTAVPLQTQRIFLSNTFEYAFQLGEHPCFVQVRVGVLSGQKRYVLAVDGKQVPMGQPISSASQDVTPPWTWLFVAGCLVLLVAALVVKGEPFAKVLFGFWGVGCAFMCVVESRDATKPEKDRIVMNAAIMVGICWLPVFVLGLIGFVTLPR